MPLYDFVCQACGKTSEILVRSSAAAVACPACGSGKLERRVSASAVIVKGGSAVSGGAASATKKSCARTSCAGCSSHCH